MGWTPLPAGTQGIITHNFIPSDGEYQIAVDVGDLVEIQEGISFFLLSFLFSFLFFFFHFHFHFFLKKNQQT